MLLDLINKLLQTLLPWAVAECEDGRGWVLPRPVDEGTAAGWAPWDLTRVYSQAKGAWAEWDQKCVFIQSQFKTSFSSSSSLSYCSDCCWCFGEICTFFGRKMEKLCVCVNHIPFLVLVWGLWGCKWLGLLYTFRNLLAQQWGPESY